nr:hypothetical protein GCM10025699_09350 [Microbacterium flavescens]
MSTFLSVSFTEAGAVCTGPSEPALQPADVSTVPLAAGVLPPGFRTPLTHGWAPMGGEGLTVTVDAPFFGEFALEVVAVGVDAAASLGIGGGGSPAALSSLPPRPAGSC